MAKSSDTVSNYLSLLSEIESKRFVPIYLLHGDETYFIDSLTDALENNVLPEAERSFNQSVVYGKDIKMADLIAMVKRYPMMSDYQLIVVKDAQDLKEWDLLLNFV
jgi:DNA polymerase-3 subunit delta